MRLYHSSDPAVWFILRGCFSLTTLRKYMDIFAGMTFFGWRSDGGVESLFYIGLKSNNGWIVVFVFRTSRLNFTKENRLVFRDEIEFDVWREGSFKDQISDDPVDFLFWQLIGCESFSAVRYLRRWKSVSFWFVGRPQLACFPESGFCFSSSVSGKDRRSLYLIIRCVRGGRILKPIVCERFYAESEAARLFINISDFSATRGLSGLIRIVKLAASI